MRLVVITVLCVCITSPAPAGPPAQLPYTAKITAEDVYVRSGPGQSYYPTDKLDKGAKVEVYRHDPGGWYAIRPPEDSFAWVSARYLTPGEGNLAVVSAENVAARVGSRFSDIRDVIQVRLRKSEVVEVLGAETDDRGEHRWYKIAPPAGEFRWISGRYAEPTGGDDSLADAVADPADSLTDPLLEAVAQFDPSTGAGQRIDPLDGAPVAAEVPDTYDSLSTQRRELSAEQFDEAIEQLDLELSTMVAEEPTVWSFDRLRQRARRLAAQCQTAVERGRCRKLLDKLERFSKLERRYEQLTQLKQAADHVDLELARRDRFGLTAPTTSPATPNPDQPQPSRQQPYPSPIAGRFDGIGTLSHVATTKLGAPRYVLLDDAGEPNCYLTPAPGVNVRHYIGQRVGVTGTSGYIPEKRSRHVTASHIRPLESRLR